MTGEWVIKYRYLFDLKENSRPIHSNDKINLDKLMTELKKIQQNELGIQSHL